MNSLELLGVSYSTGGRQLLKPLSLALRSGELLGIVGPNGAGKTTLLRLGAGEYRASEGDVVLNGKNSRSGQRGCAPST